MKMIINPLRLAADVLKSQQTKSKMKKIDEDPMPIPYKTIGGVVFDENNKMLLIGKIVDIVNSSIPFKPTEKKVYALFDEMLKYKIFCSNYMDYDFSYDIDWLKKCSTIELIVCLTKLQRADYWDGGYTHVIQTQIDSGFIPVLIKRIKSINRTF